MDSKKDLFSGFKKLLDPFRIWLNQLYDRFTTNSDELSKAVTEGGLEPALVEFYATGWDGTSWRYDPSTGIRTEEYMRLDEITGEVFPNIKEFSFDNWIISYIDSEKSKIFEQLDDLVNQPHSYEVIHRLCQIYLIELKKIKSGFVDFRYPGITEKSTSHAFEVLSEIEELLMDDLIFKPKEKLSISTTVSTRCTAPTIKKLYKELVDKNFILDKEDKSNIFLDFFRGTVPDKADRIIWGSQRALKFFVDELEKMKITSGVWKGQPAFVFPKNKWAVTSQWFIGKKGKEFKYLGNSKHSSAAESQKISAILNGLVI